MPMSWPPPSTSRATATGSTSKPAATRPCATCARSASRCATRRMRPRVEIRKVSLSKTDPGDAVLDGGTPLIDDFGQYAHADWPGKARSFAALKQEWDREDRMLVPKARDPGVPVWRLRDGKAQGHGLLPRREDRRALVVRRSGGLPLLFHGRERRGRRAAAHADRRALQVVLRAFRPPRRSPRPTPRPDPLRDPVSFYVANLLQRFGRDWRTPSAQLTSRRMRAWGLNTAYGAALNEALPAGLDAAPALRLSAARLAAERRRHHGTARRVFRRLREARRRRSRAATRRSARTTRG